MKAFAVTMMLAMVIGFAAMASHAQESPAATPLADAAVVTSPNDYASVLLEVYGAMQAVRGVKEICAEAYPEFREKNEAAHVKWLESYKSVRLDVARRVEALLASEAGGDAKKKLAMRNSLRQDYKEMKDGLREQYRDAGGERFRNACEQYPAFTRGDAVNIPAAYRTQLEIIRTSEPESGPNPETAAASSAGKTGTQSSAKAKVKATKPSRAKLNTAKSSTTKKTGKTAGTRTAMKPPAAKAAGD